MYYPPAYVPYVDTSAIYDPSFDYATEVIGDATTAAMVGMATGYDAAVAALDEARVDAIIYLEAAAERAAIAAEEARLAAEEAAKSNTDKAWDMIANFFQTATEGIFSSIFGGIGNLVDVMTEPLNWLAEELGEFVGAFAAGLWGELEDRL